jgi:hypothetical protein
VKFTGFLLILFGAARLLSIGLGPVGDSRGTVQEDFAIVDQRGNIIVDRPSDVIPPGQIRQFNIFPDRASAASQMVEWKDEKIETSHFQIVPVTVIVSATP